MNALDAAKRYAQLGWPCMALEPGGKEPLGSLFPRGVNDASTNLNFLADCWRREPAANIGIACRSFLVVDIDPRHDGDARMAEWVKEFGKLPPTPVAQTGGGGYHYLFQPVDFPRLGKIGAKSEKTGQCGVDILQGARYIVAAPSVTTGPYRWLRAPTTPLAPLPGWLASLIRRPEPPPAVRVALTDDIALERRIERARAYCEKADAAVSGQNGSTRTFVLAQHVARGFALDANSALRAMAEWNARCSPPWPEAELRRKIQEALQKGEIQTGSHLT